MATDELNEATYLRYKKISCILCRHEMVEVPSDMVGALKIGPKCAALSEDQRRAMAYANPALMRSVSELP